MNETTQAPDKVRDAVNDGYRVIGVVNSDTGGPIPNRTAQVILTDDTGSLRKIPVRTDRIQKYSP